MCDTGVRLVNTVIQTITMVLVLPYQIEPKSSFFGSDYTVNLFLQRRKQYLLGKTELIFSFSVLQSKKMMWVKVITEFYILSNRCLCKCVFVVVFKEF